MRTYVFRPAGARQISGHPPLLGDLPGHRPDPPHRRAARRARLRRRRAGDLSRVRARRHRARLRPGRRRPRQRAQDHQGARRPTTPTRAPSSPTSQTHPQCTGKLGVMGICIGGHLAFRAAMNPEVLAGTCFYATDIHKGGLGKGMKDDSLARIPEIKGELLMIWGRQDPHVPARGPRQGPRRARRRRHEFHLARVQRRPRLPARRGLPLRSRARAAIGLRPRARPLPPQTRRRRFTRFSVAGGSGGDQTLRSCASCRVRSSWFSCWP